MLKDKKRFLYMVAVGILVAILMKILVYAEVNNHPRYLDYIATIIITIVVWEGNLWIDYWMNRHYPWVFKTTQRVLFHFPTALLYSAVAIYSLMVVHNEYICHLDVQHKKLMESSLIVGIMISVILLSFEIGGQLLKGWKNSLIEVERYKTESAQAQLQNLKDQINPHFLFNNLSVLSSLVYSDQDKASEFIAQLSKVYRYLLDNKNNELVHLDLEMKFTDSYIYLLQIRFDKNIQFNIQLEKEKLQTMIPPMSLQMLIENCIKHNEISSEFPLTINILNKKDYLEVHNTLRPRLNPEPSSKSGLKNIEDRYRYFTDRPIEIIQSEIEFIVRIPLLPRI